MRYILSRHAEKVIDERGILLEWVERTLNAPELTECDPEGTELRRYYCRIPEFGGRVLRVVLNETIDPPRVVSVFFDRRMKGRI